jgi:hypothetical protein
MKKYLVLYHAPVSAREQMAAATPEQAKAGMDAWMTWAKKAGNAIADLGAPLGNGRSIKGTAVSGSGGTVVGYSILQADSMEAIMKVLNDHPHLRMPNSSIEVFEALPIPGM